MAQDKKNSENPFLSVLSSGLDAFFGVSHSRKNLPGRARLNQALYQAMFDYWNEITSYLSETERKRPEFQTGGKGDHINARLREKLKEVYDQFKPETRYNDFGLLEQFQLSLGKQLHRSFAATSSYHREIEFELEKLWDRFWALQKKKEYKTSQAEKNAEKLRQSYASVWEQEAPGYFQDEENESYLKWINKTGFESATEISQKISRKDQENPEMARGDYVPSDSLLTIEKLKKILLQLQKVLPGKLILEFRNSMNETCDQIDWTRTPMMQVSALQFPLFLEAAYLNEKFYADSDTVWNGPNMEGIKKDIQQFRQTGPQSSESEIRDEMKARVLRKLEAGYVFNLLDEQEKEKVFELVVTGQWEGREIAVQILEEIRANPNKIILRKLFRTWFRIFINNLTRRPSTIAPMTESMEMAFYLWYAEVPEAFREPATFSRAMAQTIIRESSEKIQEIIFAQLMDYQGNWLFSQLDYQIAKGNYVAQTARKILDLSTAILEKQTLRSFALDDPKAVFYWAEVLGFDAFPPPHPPADLRDKADEIRNQLDNFKKSLDFSSSSFEDLLETMGPVFQAQTGQAGKELSQDNFFLEQLSENPYLTGIFKSALFLSYHRFLIGKLRESMGSLFDTLTALFPENAENYAQIRDQIGKDLAQFGRGAEEMENPMSLFNLVDKYLLLSKQQPEDIPMTVLLSPPADLRKRIEGKNKKEKQPEQHSQNPWDQFLDIFQRPPLPGSQQTAFWEPANPQWKDSGIALEKVLELVILKELLFKLREVAMENSGLLNEMNTRVGKNVVEPFARIIQVEYESLIYRYAPGYLTDSEFDPNIAYDIGTLRGVIATFEREIQRIFERKYRSGQ